MTKPRIVLALALIATAASLGCFPEVDTDDLPSAEGYEGWPSFVTDGDAPGHGDRQRIIYVNDVALGYVGAGEYPLGSVLVKEILTTDGEDIDYLAIMRRTDIEPDGATLYGTRKTTVGGWILTRRDPAPDDPEIQGLTCWDGCHVQAPYAGTWFDYGALFAPRQ